MMLLVTHRIHTSHFHSKRISITLKLENVQCSCFHFTFFPLIFKARTIFSFSSFNFPIKFLCYKFIWRWRVLIQSGIWDSFLFHSIYDFYSVFFLCSIFPILEFSNRNFKYWHSTLMSVDCWCSSLMFFFSI